MTYTFHIKQKNWLRILSVFHLLVAFIFIFDLLHVYPQGKKDWIFLITYSIACFFILLAGLFPKKILKNLANNIRLLAVESILMLCGAIYFWTQNVSLVAFSHGVLAGVIILFWIYLKQREKGEVIVVSETTIVIPGISSHRIVQWDQLSNLVKKHDLLTIDFKNNKLLQIQVIDDDDINEEEFNQFCRQQLTKK